MDPLRESLLMSTWVHKDNPAQTYKVLMAGKSSEPAHDNGNPELLGELTMPLQVTGESAGVVTPGWGYSKCVTSLFYQDLVKEYVLKEVTDV